MPSGLHRTYGAHHLHSITCSCYRRLLFLSLVRNRDCYLSILEQVRQRYRFVLVGYVVMPEHFDLLIAEPEIGNAYLPILAFRARQGGAVNYAMSEEITVRKGSDVIFTQRSQSS